MTNIDIFLVEKEIVESLQNNETAKCLAWCNDNKSKLKKINVSFDSIFYFILLRQAFRVHYGLTYVFRIFFLIF